MFKSNMIWVNRYSKRFFCKPSYKEQINACCCRHVVFESIEIECYKEQINACCCRPSIKDLKLERCYKEQINACCCRHGLVKMENILVIRNK